jgi:hypothetical protein
VEVTYSVRFPDQHGGPYGPSEGRFLNFGAAKAWVEVEQPKRGEVAYVDRIQEWTETVPGVGSYREFDIDDEFYAEYFNGEWLIEERAYGS